MRALLLAPVVVVLLSQFDGEEPAATPAQILSTVADAGTLAQAHKDLFAASFNASGFSADGGTGVTAFSCGGPTCKYKVAEGSSMEVTAGNNELDFRAISAIRLSTAFAAAYACPSNASCYSYADTGQWFYLFPNSDLTGCVANREGGLRANSTNHGLRYCDGTTIQTVAFALANTANIDFASMNTQETDSKTMTITGALTSDAVSCTPVNGGTMQGTDMHPTVTSSNTVTIVAHNDTGGTIDPSAMDIKCVIVRAP